MASKTYLVITALTLVGGAAGWATNLPASAVDHYRVQSQYGPEEALLSPRYDRDGRLEAAVGGAFVPLSSLTSSQALTASVVYNINRRHAIEPIYYGFLHGSLSSFVKNQIAAKESASTNDTLKVDVPHQILMASYFFTPYYSKLHMATHSVLHFDIYFGAGAGMIDLVSTSLSEKDGASSWAPVFSADLGFRFLFGNNLLGRLEFRNLIYSSADFGKSSEKVDLQMGLAIGTLL